MPLLSAYPLSNDDRITKHNVDLNGISYSYLLGTPSAGGYKGKGTVFLIHGWPDLAVGWRNQIPLLLDLGYRVVCPDLVGFGGTDAPRVPPESISLYCFKRIADDVKELARQLGSSKIILGGHDWGGAIVYRIALWHPDLIEKVFAVCTPYLPPSKSYTPLENLVKSGELPNFGYQLQLASGELEKTIKSREEIKQMLNALYGARGPKGEFAFSAEHGLNLELLPHLEKTILMSEEMLEYYADEYARNGIHGTLNWYRNREQNFKEELALSKETIDVPVLFVQATKDRVLLPEMSKNMGRYIPRLTKISVWASHWALWEKTNEVNAIIKEWLEGTSRKKKARSAL